MLVEKNVIKTHDRQRSCILLVICILLYCIIVSHIHIVLLYYIIVSHILLQFTQFLRKNYETGDNHCWKLCLNIRQTLISWGSQERIFGKHVAYTEFRKYNLIFELSDSHSGYCSNDSLRLDFEFV